jgi:phosphocarrier protein HPr
LVEAMAILANKHGLHARPAAEFVKLASGFDADVKISKDGFTVDGKSIMGVMMLAAERGSSIVLSIDGPDECEALEALKGFLESENLEDELS